MFDMHETRILARELRKVRENPPNTIGEALPMYETALLNARSKGVSVPGLLLIGELLWIAIRPEEDPATDAIGAALKSFWKKYDADIAFCMERPRHG